MKADDIKRVAVVGAGLMGHGIAQEFALAGYAVSLHDITDEKLEEALKDIQNDLRWLTDTGLITGEQAKSAPARIHTSTCLDDTVSGVDLVVEAVFEDLDLKQRTFQELDRLCPERTILASNTSTLMPSKFASVTRRPDKVLVVHYFNPPLLIPLVEVVRGEDTSNETVTAVCDLLTQMGKSPVVVEKEAPGFIVNRLQVALLREALSLVRQGIASPRDVDTAMKTSMGRRWAVAGVFEVFDLAGWDVLQAIVSEVLPHVESSSEVPALLQEKVERDELGVKTGQGFYEWTPETAEALKQRIAKALIAIAQWPQ
jgi:3-hydroxybutyryl-CoA dehydrogenase